MSVGGEFEAQQTREKPALSSKTRSVIPLGELGCAFDVRSLERRRQLRRRQLFRLAQQSGVDQPKSRSGSGSVKRVGGSRAPRS